MIHTNSTEPTRRQRKRAQKMNRFIDLALVLVQEGGLNNLTMPKLADRADVAVGGLYRYFASKEVLQVALQARCAESYIAFLNEYLKSQPTADDLDCIVSYANSLNAFAEAYPVEHSLLDGALSNPVALLDDTEAIAVDRILRDALHPIAAAFKRAEERGIISEGNPWQRTYAIWAAMHGVGHFKKRDRFLPEHLHAKVIRKLLIDSLIHGWRR